MIRKQVYIDPRQERELKRLARHTGKTEAEIIRESLDRYAQQAKREKERRKAWEEHKAFLRQWMAKGPVPGGERAWKREDLYDRGRPGGH